MDSSQRTKYDRQAQMLANRAKKRFNHLRKRFARQNIEVFRLYDWDIPEIRVVVDWYDGHLVIGEYTRKQTVPEWLPLMGQAVAAALGVPAEKVHLKARRAGRQGGRRYERIGHTDSKIIVSERDLRFFVNPYDYVDTGLFADHRNTRQMVRELAAGRDFLNLYCYTGAFTCYAAKGGARSTLSVDRADTAIRWARQNLELNAIHRAANELIQMHAFDFLAKARKAGFSYDLAVVDPPSYSTTRAGGEQFDILRDHPRLLDAVVAIMRPGAKVFFSTNHQDFTLRLDALKIKELEEITTQTIPEDYVRKRTPIHRCWQITI